jgi:transcriptional regulator with XRE-family HTH domain
MRSKYLQQVLDETPREIEIFVEKYGDLVMRIHEILEAKGLSQNGLAANLGKNPSEISKWLSGEHNLTLRTIAKLEAELGESLLIVPQNRRFETTNNIALGFIVPQSQDFFCLNAPEFTSIKQGVPNTILSLT